MEKTSFKSLAIKQMPEIVNDAIKFIESRQKGLEPSLKVKSKKINDTFLDGFDWGRIATVAGMSGAGKSTLVRQWLTEITEINEQPIEVLSFQFEMMSTDEVARDVATKVDKTVKEIYSAGTALSEADLKKVKEELTKLSEYNFNIVDNRGTVREIKDTITNFVETKKLADSKKGLIITIDNSLLVKREDGQGEKDCIDELMFTLVEIKKYLASIGVKTLIFLISQLNRNIESVERVTNPKLHYPNKNDLFGASSVYNASDYVIITHKPCIIDGLGNWYGPSRKGWPQGLPVFNPSNPAQPMIYFHIIKERFGNPSIIAMLDDLKIGKISEFVRSSEK